MKDPKTENTYTKFSSLTNDEIVKMVQLDGTASDLVRELAERLAFVLRGQVG